MLSLNNVCKDQDERPTHGVRPDDGSPVIDISHVFVTGDISDTDRTCTGYITSEVILEIYR